METEATPEQPTTEPRENPPVDEEAVEKGEEQLEKISGN